MLREGSNKLTKKVKVSVGWNIQQYLISSRQANATTSLTVFQTPICPLYEEQPDSQPPVPIDREIEAVFFLPSLEASWVNFVLRRLKSSFGKQEFSSCCFTGAVSYSCVTWNILGVKSSRLQ